MNLPHVRNSCIGRIGEQAGRVPEAHAGGDELDAASPAVSTVPESSLRTSDTPESIARLRLPAEQVIGWIPQGHRQHVDPTARFVILHCDQVPEQAGPGFEHSHFRRGGQMAAEYDEVEVHCSTFPGKAEETVGTVCRGRDRKP